MTNKKHTYLLWSIIVVFIILSIFSLRSIYNEYNAPSPDKYIYATSEDKQHYSQASKALATELKTYKQQFTLLSDTNHKNLNILAFLADDATMQSFADLGYKNIFLEIRQDFQKFADKIIAGKMTPEQYAQAKVDEYAKYGRVAFKERSIYEAKIISNAAKHGLNVFCAEGQKSDLRKHNDTVAYTNDIEVLHHTTMKDMRIKNTLRDPKKLAHGLISYITGTPPEGDRVQQQIIDGYKALVNSETPLSRIVLRQYKTVLETRLRGDIHLANFIKDKAKADKSIILYGANHGRNKCDLNNHLNAKRISIFSNILDAKFGWQNTQIANGELTTSLVINQEKIYDTKAVNNNVIKESPLPAKYFINLCAGTDGNL